MPTIPHIEKHFTSSETVRDVVLGMADGLTVPFALAAGLSGAVAASKIIVTAGLAEIAAGSIAMGLGGYLAARTDREHYVSERARELRETEQIPRNELDEVAGIFRDYGLPDEQIRPILATISADKDRWVDFMMRFELGLEVPDPKRARRSAVTIALSYVFGGLIPLVPYMLTSSVELGLSVSAVCTMVALFAFGWVKGKMTGMRAWRSGLQTLAIGSLAAGAAFALARIIG
jgi:VIT1/CCC1 family predicted Fe2+/Mn2+ transporter